LLRARSSRSPRSGDCIIATNAAPPSLSLSLSLSSHRDDTGAPIPA
jgi:hypothetical protein